MMKQLIKDDFEEFLEKFTVTGRASSPENEAPRFRIIDCFTPKFWTSAVVDPSGSVFYYWSMILMFAILYNLMLISVRCVFDQVQDENLVAFLCLDYICDAAYLVDIFIGSRRGFLDGGLLVTDTKRLTKKYVWSWKFILDVLSLLPFDIFYMWTGVKAYMRLNRLAKIGRFNEFFMMAETRTNFPNIIRISNVIMYIIILIHWFGCAYFGLSYIIGYGKDAWVYPDITLPGHNTFWNQYSYCFYWATLTLTTIGDTDHPVTPAETWFCVLCSLMGVLIFATVFGNVGAMIKNMDGDRIQFQTKIDTVKSYMELRGIGPDLQERVIKWYDYTWKNKQSVDDKKSLKLFPEKLRAEISIHVHMDTLRKVAILQDCEPGFLVELVTKLKLQVYSPGDYICKKGDIGREMYIVKRGKLQVVSEDGRKVFVTLTDGAVFGEISVLNIAGNKTGNRRTANVKAVGFADLFCLTKHDLWECMQDYPQAKQKLVGKGKELLRRDNLLDEELEQLENKRNMDISDKIDVVRDMIEGINESHSSMKKTVDTVSAEMQTNNELNENIKQLNERMDNMSQQMSAMRDLDRYIKLLCGKVEGMPGFETAKTDVQTTAQIHSAPGTSTSKPPADNAKQIDKPVTESQISLKERFGRIRDRFGDSDRKRSTSREKKGKQPTDSDTSVVCNML